MAEIYSTRAIFFPSSLITGTTGPWNLEGGGTGGVALPTNTASLIVQTNVALTAGHCLMRLFNEGVQPVGGDFTSANSLPILGNVASGVQGVTKEYTLNFGPAGTRTGANCPWFYFSGGALPSGYNYLAISVILTSAVSPVSNNQQIGNQ
jgi:hypothetical protein